MRNKLLFALALVCAYFVGCADYDDSSDNHSVGPNEKEAVIDTARYTVIIYGNAGGDMDSIIEGVYEQMPSLMKSKDVRVFFTYKYGADSSVVGYDEDDNLIKTPFNGKYAEPGQLVAFEMTKDLDLDAIKNNARMAGDSIMMHDPGRLSSVLDYVADSLPAKDYVLVFWGHGQGFDFDVDFPELHANRTALAKSQDLAAVMLDEWTLDLETGVKDGMNIYEIKEEIEYSKIKHLAGLYFHNCFMGNFETLSEVYTVADYMVASEHVLESDGTLILNLVKELYKKDSFQEAVKASFKDSKDHWRKENKKMKQNGDLSLLKSSEISSFFPIFKDIAKRLNTLYEDPKQKDIIDNAVLGSYYTGEWDSEIFFNDVIFFANVLASFTEDSSLIASTKELKKAYERLVVDYIDAHYSDGNDIPSFSLSVLLTPQSFYNDETVWGYTRKEAYENTTFHKKTGWGNLLSVLDGLDVLYEDPTDPGDEGGSGDGDEGDSEEE